MAIRLLLSALVLAFGCGDTSGARREVREDALVIDCVGAWRGGAQVLKVWGDHPDYEPDYATAYRTDDRDAPAEELRYHVAGRRLRLWRHHGREVLDVPFTLVRDERAAVYRYQLRFEAPVLGQRVFEGDLAASYNCTPRAN